MNRTLLLFLSLISAICFRAHAQETQSIEASREASSGLEWVRVFIGKKNTRLEMNSNMMNFGERTQIGFYERTDSSLYEELKQLISSLDLDERNRHTGSPHSLQLKLNQRLIYPDTKTYRKLKGFLARSVNSNDWSPVNAKIVHFKKNGTVTIKSYAQKKKVSEKTMFSARICEKKLLGLTCSTQLGTIYAPAWARQLPGYKK